MTCKANDREQLVHSGIYCARIGVSKFQIDRANCFQVGEDEANFHEKRRVYIVSFTC